MTNSFVINFGMLLILNAIFLLFCFLILSPIAAYRHATYAVLRRNFLGYFANPTGYVFISLFVVGASFAAFVPHEFFNSNLATLGQLNKWLPIIMLIYIPTITMSIWAEEKRQGTDELLLTIPADDWDIVFGKYLAAVGVFTASLMVSQVSNFFVLGILAEGDVDVGLFTTTYLGYWLMGLAMLALGMAASFLTSNLTVGFVLGILFIAPLALTSLADMAIGDTNLAQSISRWSYLRQFADFGRGVISFRAVTFFVAITALGLYMSIILIGRRHWWGGKDGESLLGHYVIRALALLFIAVGLNLFFTNHDRRADLTTEQVSSLSPQTRTILKDIEEDDSILIEAFISNEVPEEYAQKKLDLIAMLNEFRTAGGKRVDVRIHDNLETFSEEAQRAEEQYGIEPRNLTVEERGKLSEAEFFLGFVVRAGLDKVVVPFLDRGIPVEYELVRSIKTVSQPKRQRIGIVKTDANMFGGMQMMGMAPQMMPKEAIVEELEKQYEVVEVDPNNPITDRFDALLAVQPSSLTQPQLDNLIDTVSKGQPTAIFEDPMPVILSSVVGTGQPKRPQGGMFGGGQPPEQKGDISRLWDVLGINMVGRPGGFGGGFDADVIWQLYNPYPKIRIQRINEAWVFASRNAPNGELLNTISNENSITKGLEEILFLFCGAIEKNSNSKHDFTKLVTTIDASGTVTTQAINSARGDLAMLDNSQRKHTNDSYVLAARIRGANDKEKSDDDKDDDSSGEKSSALDVVFVADIDMLARDFLQLRAQPDQMVEWKFENVTFVLNIIDSLAKQEDILEVRKRRTRHSTLRLVERYVETAQKRALDKTDEFKEKFNKAQSEAEKKRDEAIAEAQAVVDKLREDAKKTGNINSKALEAALIKTQLRQQDVEAKFGRTVSRLERDQRREIDRIENSRERDVRSLQNRIKAYAVTIPVLPPLLVGLVVFLKRKTGEREGITDQRRR